ncbi:hypothetical protein ACFFWD_27720 [Bradyrhizobium erythrophlei]|uniref:hypothetical protein n=1 Tax=Bradyrhizobium erythrophlei TaxID=1437360 RepID=UPI0035EEFA6B
MNQKLDTVATSARKGYIHSIIDAVEVDDKSIRIIGSKDILQAAIAGKQIENGNVFAVLSANGAPRPMKMGTTVSPWIYDAATHHALQSASQRRPAILCYASLAATSILQDGPVTLR